MVAFGLLPVTPIHAEEADNISPYCAYIDEKYQKPRTPDGSSTDGLCDIIALALQANPELQAARLELESLNGRILQASLRPNPSIDAELDRPIGSKTGESQQKTEMRLLLIQPIELGSKREHREKVAQSEKSLAQATLAIQRADLIDNIKTAYIEALGARETLTLAERRKTIADEFVAAAKRRASAGGGSAVEQIKAQISLSTSEISLEQARQDFEAALRKITSILGASAKSLKIDGRLENTVPPPTWESMSSEFPKSLDVRRSQLEASRRRAEASLEEAKAWRDISISGGVRYAQESRDTGVLVGISVPIPVSDRNQGAILEARKNVAASEFSEKSAVITTEAALKDSFQNMSTAYALSERLKNDILQNAERALDASAKAYRLGKLSYLEVIDAQRTLFDAREQFINALTTYHTSRSAAERLIGRGLGQFSGTDGNRSTGDKK
jgi:cobalt-zinc-cadmium efflux system outer membrane protein